MTNTTIWTETDGWILMSIYWSFGEQGVYLRDIIRAADALNHAIPTTDELNSSFTKFVQTEILSIKDGRFTLSPEILPVLEKVFKSCNNVFTTKEKCFKKLKNSKLKIKNNNQINLSDAEVISAK